MTTGLAERLFASISSNEMAVTAGGAPTRSDDCHPILPVPDDAPRPSFRHHRLGEASARWAYRDAAGI